MNLTPEEDRPRAIKNIRRMLAGEALAPTEYKIVRKDGSIFPCLIKSSRRFSENEVTGFRALVMDITELKKTQEELKTE